MGEFKKFVLQEGDLLDAVKVGVKAGLKAFTKKREQQQTKQESKTLANKILDAEGKELEGLIKQIVDNKFSIKNVQPQKSTDWLLECTSTKTRSS